MVEVFAVGALVALVGWVRHKRRSRVRIDVVVTSTPNAGSVEGAPLYLALREQARRAAERAVQ